jgi:hypothetical protein
MEKCKDKKGQFLADIIFVLKILPAVVRNCYLHSSNYYRIPAEGIFARIIQRAYRKYRKRPASLAKCAWSALRSELDVRLKGSPT